MASWRKRACAASASHAETLPPVLDAAASEILLANERSSETANRETPAARDRALLFADILKTASIDVPEVMIIFNGRRLAPFLSIPRAVFFEGLAVPEPDFRLSVLSIVQYYSQYYLNSRPTSPWTKVVARRRCRGGGRVPAAPEIARFITTRGLLPLRTDRGAQGAAMDPEPTCSQLN